VLVQLRNRLVADVDRVNVREDNTKHPQWLGCGGPPESSGHGMQKESLLGALIIEYLGLFILGALSVSIALWAFTSWGEFSGLGLIPLAIGGLILWGAVLDLRDRLRGHY
jgi:hypothetical protein